MFKKTLSLILSLFTFGISFALPGDQYEREPWLDHSDFFKIVKKDYDFHTQVEINAGFDPDDWDGFCSYPKYCFGDKRCIAVFDIRYLVTHRFLDHLNLSIEETIERLVDWGTIDRMYKYPRSLAGLYSFVCQNISCPDRVRWELTPFLYCSVNNGWLIARSLVYALVMIATDRFVVPEDKLHPETLNFWQLIFAYIKNMFSFRYSSRAQDAVLCNHFVNVFTLLNIICHNQYKLTDNNLMVVAIDYRPVFSEHKGGGLWFTTCDSILSRSPKGADYKDGKFIIQANTVKETIMKNMNLFKRIADYFGI